MKFHWKVLLWMVAGVVVGLAMQGLLPAPAWSGLTLADHADGLVVTDVAGPAAKGKDRLARGDLVRAAILHRGGADEELALLDRPEDFAAVLERSRNGEVVWLVPVAGARPGDVPVAVALGMDPACARAFWLKPVVFLADIFMALLKMLIVPLVLSSIVTGVAGVGTLKDLRRLGAKTFAYYIVSSLLAILLGQALVNTIRPGDEAQLGLSALAREDAVPDESFVAVLKRMVPENIFESLSDGAMLPIIFFALVPRVLHHAHAGPARRPHPRRLRELLRGDDEDGPGRALTPALRRLLPDGQGRRGDGLLGLQAARAVHVHGRRGARAPRLRDAAAPAALRRGRLAAGPGSGPCRPR